MWDGCVFWRRPGTRREADFAELSSIHVSDYQGRLASRSRRSLVILGMVATGLVLAAIYAAAVAFFIGSRPGLGDRGASRDQPAQEANVSPSELPIFPASDYEQARYPERRSRPLLGVNYTHHAFPNCSFNGTGILRSYSKPGIAAKVHAQLLRMRKAGIQTIRTIIWHMTDATGQIWGPIPSAGGRPSEPYRTNLIRYLTEVRRFGFARLTVSFGPQQDNNPLLSQYDQGKFSENWRFIQTVRALVKRHGPRDTRIDLLNEAAPSSFPTEWTPDPRQTGRYLKAMYRRYVQRFGNRDVSVSAISWDKTNRVQTLIRLLKSTGQPLPRWYDVHIGYTRSQALYGLRNTDMVLAAEGVKEPLVIGETSYDSRSVAQTIRSFIAGSARQVEEVSPWYIRTMEGCQVAPPYRPGTYRTSLRAG